MNTKLNKLTMGQLQDLCEKQHCSSCPCFNEKETFPLNCYKEMRTIFENIEVMERMGQKEIDI